MANVLKQNEKNSLILMQEGVNNSVEEQAPKGSQKALPDYIRYHKVNNLDLKYYKEPAEIDKQDGFDFRKAGRSP